MTFEQIKQSESEFLFPSDIADVLNTNPQSIRVQARENPKLLGFPVVVILSRVKIPRKPFIDFVEGKSSQQAS